MATRIQSDEPAAGVKTNKKRAAPAKKAAGAPPKKRAAPTATSNKESAAAANKAGGAAEGLLRAGLKALGNVRNDVVKRQTHVIESLLGVRVNDTAVGFGFKKFEDVFDQRVATALERLGLPDANEVQALRDEVEALRARLTALEAGQMSKPSKPGKAAVPSKKTAARRNVQR